MGLASHQAAVYAAEAAALGQLGRRWRRVAQVQRYVDSVIASAWFTSVWPQLVACTVERRGRGARWSTYQALDAEGPGGTATEGVLLLAPNALDEPTVLHELAHLLLPPASGHSPAFAEVMLGLVRHEMGFFAYADFRRELRRLEGWATVDAYTLAG